MAQRSFESAQTVLLHATTGGANDPPLQFELATVDNNIGHVLEARGHLDEALAPYSSMLVVSRKLVAAQPDNTDWADQLGDAHNNLGKLALMRGDLATAVTEYSADDVIETALAARDPRDNDKRNNMVKVHAILGRTQALTGDLDTGINDLQQAVEMSTQLTKVDPSNTDFQEDLALYSSQLARLRRLHDELPAAQALTAQSLSIFRVLTKQDPANVGWQREFAEAQTEHAAQSRAASQTDAAGAQAQAALTLLEPVQAKQPDDRATLLAIMGAKLLLASVTANAQSAAQLRNDALRTMQAMKNGAGDPRLLAMQVEAQLALGRRAEAQSVIQQLWNSGYRDVAFVAVLQRAQIAYPINASFQQKLLAATARSDHS